MSQRMAQMDFKKWVCDACGYIYDEAQGDPDSGLAPGTRFDDIPDDWECPLCGLSKSDLRLLPEVVPQNNTVKRTAKKASKSKGGDDYVVIVGAGIAGWSVIESIRQQDTSIPILLVTACNGDFYPKPALSTALAKGKSAEELIELQGLDKAEQYGIEIRTETRVIKIDTNKKRLTTAKGGIQYGKLILALGANQKELPINGDAVDSIFRINDLKSYARFRNQLENGVKHITILGAGLIGCEFAEDLTSAGYQVDILDIADHALASLLPFQIANELETTLKNKGVNWRFNTGLDSLEKQGTQFRGTLSDGQVILTDLVISAVGLSPSIQLAKKSLIDTNIGVIVDENMHTSSNDIYALGDCAEFEGEIYAYIEPIRRQAKTIAADLCKLSQVFEAKPPLVRVKTPSLPLSICLNHRLDNSVSSVINQADNHRVDYFQENRSIGFVLSGESSKQCMAVYSEIFG